MNKKGYTIPELLVVLAIVSIIAIVSIFKISYAFADIDNTEEIANQEKVLIKKASLAYSKTIIDRIKDEKIVYASGEDLIKNGFLTDDNEYKSLKIKLSYDEKNDKVKYEVVK